MDPNDFTSSQPATAKSCCPICDCAEVPQLLTIPAAPVHCNLLCSTLEEARRAPHRDISLGACPDCGHIFNLAFDPELMNYEGDYENSLHCSQRFQTYARELAYGLIERHSLRGKNLIEIGCGQGEFMLLLCELGGNRGVGFDPGYDADSERQLPPGVRFVRDFYSEQHAALRADFVYSRHVLEHLAEPRAFLRTVRQGLGGDRETIVFVEVPNVRATLHNGAIWDIIYEHYSYFGEASLSSLFRRSGFEVLDLRESFGGQFLCIEARPGSKKLTEPDEQVRTVGTSGLAAFADGYCSKVEDWRWEVEQIIKHGQRAVVWGAGSKAVTFLNVLRIQEAIKFAVDVNPRKHWKFIPGTGQQIVAPESLREIRPDVVIAMNPEYQSEIQATLDRLGVDARLALA